MNFTAQQIAALIGAKIDGNAEASINTLAKIEEGREGALSFLANPKYEEHIYGCKSSIILVSSDFKAQKPLQEGVTLLRVDHPYIAFTQLLEQYNQIKRNKKGISDQAVIEASASLGEDCYVGPFVYIGENVKIGNNVKIYPHTFIGDNVVIGDESEIFSGVKIYSETQVGKHCTFHAGVVLGSDGFGFAPNSENNYAKVPQIGNVIIEDHVEIGANACIDRATLGSTIIRKGVKLDNLIQIAHNVEVGENTVMASQTGVAGSTKIGKNAMIGGQVGIVGHLQLGEEVKIAAQSGVQHNIADQQIVQGSPAFEVGNYKRSYVGFRRLPDLMQKISKLEKQLEKLKEEL